MYPEPYEGPPTIRLRRCLRCKRAIRDPYAEYCDPCGKLAALKAAVEHGAMSDWPDLNHLAGLYDVPSLLRWQSQFRSTVAFALRFQERIRGWRPDDAA